MTVPRASLADLNAIAAAISRAKSSAQTLWSISAALGSKPQTAVTITLQVHPPGTRALEWVKLHFASARDAAQWLAFVCLWTMAYRRGLDGSGHLQAAARAEHLKTLLAPLRAALESTAPTTPTSVQLHRQGPSDSSRSSARPDDYSSQAFAFAFDTLSFQEACN